jgi:hypothetical protein
MIIHGLENHKRLRWFRFQNEFQEMLELQEVDFPKLEGLPIFKK